MSVMFAGKYTRPEILTMLSYLGSYIPAPLEADMQCLRVPQRHPRLGSVLQSQLNAALYYV
jgi:hypothetical protein